MLSRTNARGFGGVGPSWARLGDLTRDANRLFADLERGFLVGMPRVRHASRSGGVQADAARAAAAPQAAVAETPTPQIAASRAAGRPDQPLRAMPRLDVYERAEELVISVDLPGVGADELELSLDGRQLFLRGTRPATESRRAVEYSRRLELSVDVEPDGVTAELSQGVLEIRLPKPPQCRPRRIPVKGGAS